MTTYTESETGALLCDACDLWIDGIGSNKCACCLDCDGEGKWVDGEGVAFMRCESCSGTGKYDCGNAPVCSIHGCEDCGGSGKKAVAQ